MMIARFFPQVIRVHLKYSKAAQSPEKEDYSRKARAASSREVDVSCGVHKRNSYASNYSPRGPCDGAAINAAPGEVLRDQKFRKRKKTRASSQLYRNSPRKRL
jgi:hypothetical protein